MEDATFKDVQKAWIFKITRNILKDSKRPIINYKRKKDTEQNIFTIIYTKITSHVLRPTCHFQDKYFNIILLS